MPMQCDDPAASLPRPCQCHGSMEAHRRELGARASDSYVDRLVEAAVVNAVFPEPVMRRRFLAGVGAATALAAIGDAFPLAASKAIAQATAAPEKANLTIGYVPITCAVPMLLAEAMGEYAREGLVVSLARTPGWALVRDKVIDGEFDASHLVLGLPLTMTMGIGSPATRTVVSTIQNVNGNAIVLHGKHRDRRDPTKWKGMRFGIPHEQSMHAMLLRYYLAENGLDPDRDVELRVFAPPDSVANLAAGNLDGMLFAEPWGQRAVFEGIGFIHILTRDIFPDHPCCTLSVTAKFVAENPNTYGALFRAIVRATEFADKAENRVQVAEALAPAQYLNQPRTVLQQVLTGRYADGLGNVVDRPDRIGFKALPHESTAIWLLTQLRRWNIVAADVDYAAVARQVFRSTDAAKRMAEMGSPPPGPAMVGHTIMGKAFDPAMPAAYLASFPIHRN